MVTCISHTITIIVILVRSIRINRIRGSDAIVTFITYPVPIAIFLAGIGITGAVITDISYPVAIAIFLAGIGIIRAIIAKVRCAVVISINIIIPTGADVIFVAHTVPVIIIACCSNTIIAITFIGDITTNIVRPGTRWETKIPAS